MRFRYDPQYKPSAPIVEIHLGLPDQTLQTEPLRALVDTGADVVLVPLHYIESLNAESNNERYLRGYGEERMLVKIFLLDIGIGTTRFPAVPVARYQGAEAIIGRNLLNKVLMTLDGPKQELEIKL